VENHDSETVRSENLQIVSEDSAHQKTTTHCIKQLETGSWGGIAGYHIKGLDYHNRLHEKTS
jgi:hypothetical protein